MTGIFDFMGSRSKATEFKAFFRQLPRLPGKAKRVRWSALETFLEEAQRECVSWRVERKDAICDNVVRFKDGSEIRIVDAAQKNGAAEVE